MHEKVYYTKICEVHVALRINLLDDSSTIRADFSRLCLYVLCWVWVCVFVRKGKLIVDRARWYLVNTNNSNMNDNHQQHQWHQQKYIHRELNLVRDCSLNIYCQVTRYMRKLLRICGFYTTEMEHLHSIRPQAIEIQAIAIETMQFRTIFS